MAFSGLLDEFGMGPTGATRPLHPPLGLSLLFVIFISLRVVCQKFVLLVLCVSLCFFAENHNIGNLRSNIITMSFFCVQLCSLHPISLSLARDFYVSSITCFTTTSAFLTDFFCQISTVMVLASLTATSL